MKHLIWTIALLAPVTLATQEHEQRSLTVDDCTAAARVFKDEVDRPNGIKSLPFTILNHKEKEMGDCLVLDRSDADHIRDYIYVMGKYTAEMNLRALRYVERHHLMQELIDEDLKGKR